MLSLQENTFQTTDWHLQRKMTSVMWLTEQMQMIPSAFRPGIRALKNWVSEVLFLKQVLQKKISGNLLKAEGLDIWDKPAMACLLTRIPYDTG